MKCILVRGVLACLLFKIYPTQNFTKSWDACSTQYTSDAIQKFSLNPQTANTSGKIQGFGTLLNPLQYTHPSEAPGISGQHSANADLKNQPKMVSTLIWLFCRPGVVSLSRAASGQSPFKGGTSTKPGGVPLPGACLTAPRVLPLGSTSAKKCDVRT